ncbi:MAG: hypothetical protein HY396_01945, partial [Candidatus Doudnabacteria bacterium]|nr:hypothetical protein [Candidatus Doudnabacteria bacterium]
FAGERLKPYLHQPVHNIYFLITAESGILALLVFVTILYYIVRRAVAHALAGRHAVLNFTLLIVLGGFLFIGLFDHYLWTIQQGSLIFWLTLGFLSTKNLLPKFGPEGI